MPKFKFEKVKVGSIVVMRSLDGNEYELKVIRLSPEESGYPIVTTPCKPFSCRINPSLASETYFDSDSTELFSKEGWYYDTLDESGTPGTHLAGIKKPWKKFTEDMELTSGMKVRIKQYGKWIKGVVNDSCGYPSIEFAQSVESPEGVNSYSWVYTLKGEFNWDYPEDVKHLRVRQYK